MNKEMILDSPAISPSSFNYRYLLKVNEETPLKSVLVVQQQFKSGEWNYTPGQWYVGTLLNKDGFMGNNQTSDTAIIDGGLNWYVGGLIEALNEVELILDLD